MASDYISGRLKQREAEASRQFAIDTGIGPLWANLCAAIGNLVEEYARQCESEKAEWSGPFPESIWARVGAMEKSRAPQIRERNRVDVKLDRKPSHFATLIPVTTVAAARLLSASTATGRPASCARMESRYR